MENSTAITITPCGLSLVLNKMLAFGESELSALRPLKETEAAVNGMNYHELDFPFTHRSLLRDSMCTAADFQLFSLRQNTVNGLDRTETLFHTMCISLTTKHCLKTTMTN